MYPCRRAQALIKAWRAEITLTDFSELDGSRRVIADHRTDIWYERPGPAKPDSLRHGICVKSYPVNSGVTVRTQMVVGEARHPTRKNKVVQVEVIDEISLSAKESQTVCYLDLFDTGVSKLPNRSQFRSLQISRAPSL